MDKTLLIDLGGTHIRFVVLSKESNKIDSVNKKKLQSTEDLETFLKAVSYTHLTLPTTIAV